MWSHYANKHKGFCIEYDFRSLGPESAITNRLYPVLYRKNLLDVTDFMLPTDTAARFNNTIGLYASIFKSREWSYEKEWRLTFPVGVILEEQTYKVPTPKAIYMGSRIDQNPAEQVAQIEAIALSKHIAIFRALPSKRSFSLEFHDAK